MNEILMKFEHKDIWKSFGKNFCIEVSRHSEAVSDEWHGPHRWCVYAYIYPKHPLFAEFTGEDMYQPATAKLPLHWGASYCSQHVHKGKTTSFQVGADYHHLHDGHFTLYATKEDATQVFHDAKVLATFLENYKPEALEVAS